MKQHTPLKETENKSWRPLIASSSIMSLALVGDALLYAVLPVYAENFGLTLVWVGIMLSANRIIRVFAYGAIARVTHHFGVRTMCILAAIVATFSTALYGFGQGPIVMLAARILWGLTYATLVIATLGIGQAIQRIGPILALLFGAWLVGQVGPNKVFVLLAIPTALAIPIAMSLPKRVATSANKSRPGSLARPTPIDVLFFLQGYGVDGVFAISITLIFARESSLSDAVISGGALLALRHFGEAIAAPLFGWIADWFGARRVFVMASVFTMLGFIGVAMGFTIAGAIVMLVFRGALASLGPAVIAQSVKADEDVLGALARMQIWRDIGASAGPLITGFALTIVSAEAQHAMVAAAIAAGLIYWFVSNKNKPVIKTIR